MSSHSSYNQTQEKFIFNLDFNIPYEEISFFPNYDIENEGFISNQRLIEDMNFNPFLNQKRTFSQDFHLKDKNYNDDLNYSRVTSKATSADSSSNIPIIFPYSETNHHKSFFNNSSSFENIQSDINYLSNLSNEKKSKTNLSLQLEEDRDYCFDELDVNKVFDIDKINQNDTKNKLKIEEKKKEKFKITSGNPINKIIEIIEKENISLDKQNIFKNEDFQLPIALEDKSYLGINKRKIIFSSSKAISNHNQPEKDKSVKKICCSCQKSHCLKLYCECFKRQKYCEGCSCPNCLNKEKFEMIRQQSICFLKNKSKYAFKSVEILNENKLLKEHIKGCKCKNSNCQKNYCECYQNGMKCGNHCKCANCLNDDKC